MTSHAWVHGMTTRPTLLAACCCGVERHEVNGATRYENAETGEVTRKQPECTAGDDIKDSPETIKARFEPTPTASAAVGRLE